MVDLLFVAGWYNKGKITWCSFGAADSPNGREKSFSSGTITIQQLGEDEGLQDR